MVTIRERAFEALKAAAQLAAHPEVIAHTILAARDARKRIALDEAFPEFVSHEERDVEEAIREALENRPRRAYEEAK